MTVRRSSNAIVRGPRRIPAIRRHSGNPYFNKNRHRNPPAGDLGRVLLLLGLPALVLIAVGYLIWSSALKISVIKIDGATAETEKSIRQILADGMGQRRLLPADNVLFFDAEAAKANIGKSFYLDGLEIKKRLPGTIEVKVTEKTVRGAFLSDGRFLGLDGTGFVVRELTSSEMESLGDLPPEFGQAVSPELGAETALIAGTAPSEAMASGTGTELAAADGGSPKYRHPVITLEGGKTTEGAVNAGQQAIAAPAMAIILQAFSKLEEYSREPVKRFVVRGLDTDSVEAVMDGGWKAYFSSDYPFDVQADKLSLILADKIGDRRSELDYVDLRYGERIFFKFKTSE
jgi:hypothetical protein